MAVDYTDEIDAQWVIFPLHPIIRNSGGVSCACGEPDCKAIGKHPKASNWQKTQLYAEDQLEYLEDFDGEFFGNQLIDNHGVVVSTSGLLVVDVDGRNGGFESAAKLAHIREQASYIIRTGSGNGEHWYFTVPEDWKGKSLCGTLKDFPGIDFKSTGFVVGAGCEHVSGGRYETILGKPIDACDAPHELLALLDRPERSRFVSDGMATDYGMDDLRSMLRCIPNPDRDYEMFIRIGMAVHDAVSGSDDGLSLWHEWASRSSIYNPETLDRKWHSFGKSANKATVGTLITWARDHGWSSPVSFTDNTDWADDPISAGEPAAGEQEPKNKIMDEKAPEEFGGLVGALYEWIDSRCLFPRKHIALAAALTAVSSAASLRYRVDERYKVPLNLMVFCIADSGTGKEAVYQALLDALGAAGLSGAVYGEIKSEQELYRNAIRNQAAYYSLDECGALLGKIGSAKKRGGASYLEAIPAAVMKIFTKTNGYLPLGGDVREELKKEVEREIARVNKKIDDGRGTAKDDALIADLLEQYQSVKRGIKNPILGFFGITEPSSFDSAIATDKDLMVNGFLGRALMFREDEPLPLRRSDFNPRPMPLQVEAKLMHLYSGGHSVDGNDKIQLHGDAEVIHISPDAEALLDEVYAYWRGQGQALAMDGQGIHSITTRVWEMVVKVAALLSIPLGTDEAPVINRENVRQAHAIVRKVTEYKIDHCKTAIGADSKDIDERSQGMLAGVRSILDGISDGVGAGIIRNRLRSYDNPEGVMKCLEWLEQRGEIMTVEYTDARNRKHKKYVKVA